MQEKGYVEMQNEHGQTALVQEKDYIEIATLLEEAEEASLERTVPSSQRRPPFRDFLGRLDSWANSRNKVCTYKVGDNVLGCVRVHVGVACRRSGMWGEEWCGAHGVCGESGQGVRVERGGGVVAGWAAVPGFGVRRGRKASRREGGEEHNIERKECHRKVSNVINVVPLRVSIKRGVSPTCAGQWRGVINSLSCVSGGRRGGASDQDR
jgi:hypothetical protein